MGKKQIDDESFRRIHEVTNCKTQSELADFLGVQQSSISDAKKRKSVPADWLLKLLLEKHINPEWIFTGDAPRFLFPNKEERCKTSFIECDCPTIEDYNIEDLLKEISKRIGKSVTFTLTVSVENMR